MSEGIATHIRIGGNMSRHTALGLAYKLTASCVSLEWGGGQFQPDSVLDLLEARIVYDDNRVLWLYDDQAAWGEFSRLEEYLRKYEVPYTRTSTTVNGYDGQIIEYRPGVELVSMQINNNEEAVVYAESVNKQTRILATALEQLEAGNTTTATVAIKSILQDLRKILPPVTAPLPSFEIAGYNFKEEARGR